MYNGNNKTKTQKKGIPPMAIISQQTFFMWNDLNELGDLERLQLVLNYMPDERYCSHPNLIQSKTYP